MANLDISSVAKLIIILHILQVVGLLIQFLLNRDYKGNGWWLLWSISIAAGVIFLSLRSIPWLTLHAIFLQNSLILLGIVFMYTGIMRFLGRKENSLLLYSGYLVYEILMFYFLYFEDSSHARSIIFAAGMMIATFLTGYSLIRYKDKSVIFSANFLSSFMLLYVSFYIIRLIYLFKNPDLGSYMSQDWTTVLQYILGLIAGLLYTFGLIFMVNQKLHFDMKAAKEHFETVFNLSPDAVLITRLSDGNIIDINHAFTAITGFTREVSINRKTTDLGLWKDESLRKNMVNALSGNLPYINQELEFQKSDGTTLKGLFSTSLIYLKGVPHTISVTKDITERVEAENKLRQKKEELEAANSEKDRLFSVISHDLKNSFNIFLGYTDILFQDIDKFNRQEINTMAKNMNVAARNLYKLLENLLEWSVFRRGLTKINPESLSLYRLAEETVDHVHAAAQEKNIRIETRMPHDIFVMADRAMAGVILRNLLINAIKFTQRNGVIDISSYRADSRRISITVQDNGIGMSEEVRRSLFNIGSDTKRRGTDNEPSSGLGLILVNEYVTKLGGTISVESEEGKGSRFTVILPSS